jgi:hypothetical protein
VQQQIKQNRFVVIQAEATSNSRLSSRRKPGTSTNRGKTIPFFTYFHDVLFERRSALIRCFSLKSELGFELSAEIDI